MQFASNRETILTKYLPIPYPHHESNSDEKSESLNTHSMSDILTLIPNIM